MILLTEEHPQQSRDAEELTLSADLLISYLDNGDPITDLDTALDKAQGDARNQGAPQYLIIIVTP